MIDQNAIDKYIMLDRVMGEDYPEILREMAEVFFDATEDAPEFDHVEVIRRAQFAFEMAELVRSRFGGGQLYLPKGRSYAVSKIAQAIYDDFNGYNYSELMRKYNLSEVRIRQIVERVRKIRLELTQGKLDLS